MSINLKTEIKIDNKMVDFEIIGIKDSKIEEIKFDNEYFKKIPGHNNKAKGFWTNEETEILRKYYNKTKTRLLRKKLPNRSIRAIGEKAYAMGICNKYKIRKKKFKKEIEQKPVKTEQNIVISEQKEDDIENKDIIKGIINDLKYVKSEFIDKDRIFRAFKNLSENEKDKIILYLINKKIIYQSSYNSYRVKDWLLNCNKKIGGGNERYIQNTR